MFNFMPYMMTKAFNFQASKNTQKHHKSGPYYMTFALYLKYFNIQYNTLL